MITAYPQAKSNVQMASGLNVLAGIWLIIAPFILSYNNVAGSTTNDVIVGIVVLVLAAARTMGDNYKASWMSWVNFVLGVWLILAPFVLGYPTGSTAFYNDIILGIIIAVLAAVSALSTPYESEV